MAGKKSRERRVTSARRRVNEHVVGISTTSMNLPEGVSILQIKKAGTYRLDIIPYEVGDGNPFAKKGELHYERTYFVHRGIGPENSSYVCLSKTFKKPCPICEFRSKEARNPEADEDMIKNLAPKERQLFNVIDLADTDKGVQLMEYSYHLFGKALDAKVRGGDDNEYDLFADLKEGLTVKVVFEEEKGAGYVYYKASDIEMKPRKKEYDESILEEVTCLDEVPKEITYAELKKIFLQTGETNTDDDDVDDDDDDDVKPKPKKKPADEDDDDDDEEDDEEGVTADALGIVVGSWVTYDGDDCKVTHVSKDGLVLRLEDTEGEQIRGIEVSDVTVKKGKGKAATTFKVGDVVSFNYRNKDHTGTIKKVDAKTKLAHIQVKGRTDPHIVKLDELEAAEEEEAPKKKEKAVAPKKGGKKPPVKDDDDDDDDDSDSDDDDSDDDDEDDQEDEDTDDEDEDNDEDEEESSNAKGKKKAPVTPKKPAAKDKKTPAKKGKAKDDDDDDDDDDEWEDD